MIAARFYVAQVTRYAHSGGWADPAPKGDVVLRSATRGEGNKLWASSTPSGEIKMTVITSAYKWFEERLGKEVAITLDDIQDKPA